MEPPVAAPRSPTPGKTTAFDAPDGISPHESLRRIQTADVVFAELQGDGSRIPHYRHAALIRELLAERRQTIPTGVDGVEAWVKIDG